MRLAIVLAQALLVNPAVNAISGNGLQSGYINTHQLPQSIIRNDNSQPDRLLQKKRVQCPICSRVLNLGPTFLSDVIPYDKSQPNATCEIANSDSFFANADYSAAGDNVVSKCNIHQDRYEEKCCGLPESTLPIYKCNENIQGNLFEDYNTAVTPLKGRNVNLPVNTLLRFWAVKELDIKTSTLDIFVDVILSWNDPRLAWNVTSEACVTSMLARASNNAEITQIWVPELDLVNREAGLRSLEDASAQVYSDGTVRWVRSGRIKALCNFYGLGKMPFDTIGCRVVFSDPIVGNVRYTLADSDDGPPGVSFPEYSQTYTEYTIVKEESTSSDSNGMVAVYFYFERASKQHVYLVILPTIVFVCLSFGQFFFPSDTGDRVTYCVSMLLIVVAQGIVTSEFLPRSKERIWLNFFIISCQFFVIAGTCESLLFYCLIAAKRTALKKMSRRLSTDSTNEIENFDVDSDYDGSGGPLLDKVLHYVKWFDYYFMFALPLSYVFFVIIMFATLSSWDDRLTTGSQ